MTTGGYTEDGEPESMACVLVPNGRFRDPDCLMSSCFSREWVSRACVLLLRLNFARRFPLSTRPVSKNAQSYLDIYIGTRMLS
ncbi:hypothetical protein CERSUDRAFT_109874 [Gelatoporia subvermispora B]|uniref:Uncharacterized protein n=1 Tax=Ceriporiopsis subvermispora (strain B) TaxID=914234 RepID=M2RQU7_CERS8|nr:hypothetical protein CERSUDRAFT_109874 [Gelatoporia subvermispora B]